LYGYIKMYGQQNIKFTELPKLGYIIGYSIKWNYFWLGDDNLATSKHVNIMYIGPCIIVIVEE